MGLVLHVLPADLHRGAQACARLLRDALDGEDEHHEVLTLFAAPPGLLQPEHCLEVPDSRLRAAGFSPLAAWRLRRFLARTRPAVVVSHGGEPLKYLRLAMPRGSALVYYRIGTANEHLAHPWHRHLYRALVAKSRLLVAVSDDTAAEARELFGVPDEKIVVVPNTRDPEVVRRRPVEQGGHDADEVVVLSAGHVSADKGTDRFERAIVELRRRGRPVRGVVAGEGPLQAELAERATASGLEVLGHVSDMVELFSRCDVFAFPGVDREGMPGVLIEAGLCELPVVASAVPGVRDVVQHEVTGFVIDPADDEALCHRLEQLVADPALRRTMGAAARAHCVEHFSIDHVAAEWRRALAPLQPT
jgi:glycosyltransferase involved in cell wall biosynthesis